LGEVCSGICIISAEERVQRREVRIGWTNQAGACDEISAVFGDIETPIRIEVYLLRERT
jgi:hypothetical protein